MDICSEILAETYNKQQTGWWGKGGCYTHETHESLLPRFKPKSREKLFIQMLGKSLQPREACEQGIERNK